MESLLQILIFEFCFIIIFINSASIALAFTYKITLHNCKKSIDSN